jgi:histidine triad (HIT) family protein
MTSIFTRIARKELPAHVVWEDAEFMALLALQPVSSGHLLLVPKQQVDSIYNLPEKAYYRLWQIVRFLEAPLRRAIGAPRIGLAFEGFGVAHAHLHLIPVYRRGDLDPRRATTAAFEDLRPIAERIRAEIAGEPSLSPGGVAQTGATS